MNELQVALIIIGILAVAGILLYNRVQERRLRKLTEAGFAKPNKDVLLDEASGKTAVSQAWTNLNEPVFNGDDTMLDVAGGSREPKFIDEIPTREMQAETAAIMKGVPPPQAPAGSEPLTSEPADRGGVPAPAQAPHNEQIEFRVQLKSVDGMPAEAFAEVFNSCRALEKPVRWRALPLGGLEWELLQPQSRKRYLEVTASMQLVDRGGAAGKDDLSALCALAESAARANGWQVKCDEIVDALARAMSLDKFYADVDMLIGLNIVSRGTAFLPLDKIRRAAEAAGMRLQADGHYHLLDSRNETLITLTNQEPVPFNAADLEAPQTRGVTLLFDVPRVPDGLKAYDAMVALGRKLADVSGAQLVDNNQRPLTDAGIEKIRARIGQAYDRMEARGIPAGGRVALRLFS